MGVKQGITTNPSLIAKEVHAFIEVLKETISIVDGPISVGVISMKTGRMVEEAEKYAFNILITLLIYMYLNKD